MTHEELEEAVPLYAAGALERTERQALEAHLLTGCVSCHTALKEYQSVASMLPFGLTVTAPPRALKAKIMAARTQADVAVEAADKPMPSKPSLEPGEWMNHLFPPESRGFSFARQWAAAFAAVAVLAAGGYLAWNAYLQVADDSSKLHQLQTTADTITRKVASLQNQLSERDRSLQQLKDELDQRAAETIDLKDQLLQREAELEDARLQLARRGGARSRQPQDELAALLQQPTARAVSLAGSDMAKQASGFLLYDPKTQKVWLYTVNLPECPNGTTYQLWAIQDKPMSVGTFHMDTGETAHLLVKRLPEFAQAKKFAISLEPSGGRPQPTGAIYLVSQS